MNTSERVIVTPWGCLTEADVDPSLWRKAMAGVLRSDGNFDMRYAASKRAVQAALQATLISAQETST